MKYPLPLKRQGFSYFNIDRKMHGSSVVKSDDVYIKALYTIKEVKKYLCGTKAESYKLKPNKRSIQFKSQFDHRIM